MSNKLQNTPSHTERISCYRRARIRVSPVPRLPSVCIIYVAEEKHGYDIHIYINLDILYMHTYIWPWHGGMQKTALVFPYLLLYLFYSLLFCIGFWQTAFQSSYRQTGDEGKTHSNTLTNVVAGERIVYFPIARTQFHYDRDGGDKSGYKLAADIKKMLDRDTQLRADQHASGVIYPIFVLRTF